MKWLSILAVLGPSCVLADPIPDVNTFGDKLEEWRSSRLAEIKAERDKLADALKRQANLVDYLNRWAKSETDRRLELIPFDQKDSPYLARIQDQRRVFLSRIANFPWESRGAIASGRALNELIQQTGPTAASRVRRKAHLAANRNDFRGAPVLKDLSTESFNLDILKNVRFSRGLMGPKITQKIGRDILDLDWPYVLRSPEYLYLTRPIERAREKALGELRAGDPVSMSTGAELLNAVDRLRSRLLKDRRNAATDGYQKYRHYKIGYQHAEVLAQSASQFVYATELSQVEMKPFGGRTVEEFVAYVHGNGLRFARAEPLGQDAYLRLFEAILTYHVNVRYLQLAIAKEENKEEEIERRIRDLDQLESLVRAQSVDDILRQAQRDPSVAGALRDSPRYLPAVAKIAGALRINQRFPDNPFANSGRDALIKSALRDLNPQLSHIACEAIQNVITGVLERKNAGQITVDVAKSWAISELRRNDPTLGRAVEWASFVADVVWHQ